MNLYDIAFSEQRSMRIRRHMIFWIAWCMFLTIAYLIPTNWIPAWDLQAPKTHIDKYGTFLATLRIMLAAILLTLVHMLLVYGILYYFLPRFLSRASKWIPLTIELFVFISLVAAINYLNFILAFYLSTRAHYFQAMPDTVFILKVWARQVLFNYPTVVGAALAFKIFKYWYAKQQEAAQAARDKTKAELELLKAQVHPHFLFNTLNNIYSFILSNSPGAPDAIHKLSNLLRYIMFKCNRPLVNLEMELEMIKAYIDLEKIRYGESLNLSLHITGTATQKLVCPLLMIPFLENSFKHGASQMLAHPWVSLEIVIGENTLEFNLSNNKPTQPADKTNLSGIGLENVKRRLAILYPENHTLEITDDLMSYNVFLRLPIFEAGITCDLSITREAAYELA
jgi:two-component system, LytTR family, sensor kinase